MAAAQARALSMRVATVLAALIATTACEESAPVVRSAEDAGMGRLEIGKGELAFAKLAEDEALPYAAGTQGGHHVFIGFRMQALDPLRVLIEVTTAVEGHPELALTRRGRQSFDPEDARADDHEDEDAGSVEAPAPSFVYAGWPAQILDAPMHVGERARIDVLLEDRAGRTARAASTVVIAAPVARSRD
jgi:hypothetical protein